MLPRTRLFSLQVYMLQGHFTWKSVCHSCKYKAGAEMRIIYNALNPTAPLGSILHYFISRLLWKRLFSSSKDSHQMVYVQPFRNVHLTLVKAETACARFSRVRNRRVGYRSCIGTFQPQNQPFAANHFPKRYFFQLVLQGFHVPPNRWLMQA